MKDTSAEFDFLDAQRVREPRHVVGISFNDAGGDVTYLTSHTDAQVPGGTAAIDRIDSSVIGITGLTQRVIPERAQHTIGSLTVRLRDVGGALSTKIKTKLDAGEGLRDKQITFRQGFNGIGAWSQYALRATYFIDGVQQKDGVYTIRCSDVNRKARDTIFSVHQGVLTSTLSATATTVPITVADAANQFPLLQHDANYEDAPSSTVGYIKIGDEIIRHTGWTDGTFTALQVDTGGRGVMGTTAVEHTITASEDDQKETVEEYIYLQMAGPRLIYALLTGEVEGQAGDLPSHWHLGISTSFVRLSDFTSTYMADLWNTSDDTGRMFKFHGLTTTQGKKFIEEQLLLLIGAFMPVYADGTVGIRRLQAVYPYAPYTEFLGQSSISKYGALEFDQKAVINQMVVNWNYLDNIDRYNRRSVFIDDDSIGEHGAAPARVINARGLFTGLHNEGDIRTHFAMLRDRFAAPPMRLDITVHPYFARLEVGDVVRVKLSQFNDYHLDEPLDRSFEIQQMITNWVTGEVRLRLFGGIKSSTQVSDVQSAVMSDSFYNATGTDLSTVLTMSGGNITANGNLPAGVYYYLGDLTLNAGVTVTINGDVEIRARGDCTINGKFDGAGRGLSGATATATQIGAAGTEGATGDIGLSRAVALLGPLGASSFYFAQSTHRNPDRTVPAKTITGLNIQNPDGLSITGVPSTLQGSSGSAGDGAVSNASGSTWSPTYRAIGGDGGDGGASLKIISRGGGFGLAGEIDVSGGDSSLGGTAVVATRTVHGAPGVPGSAGAVVWLIDGNEALPDKTKVTAMSGDAPVPSVDVLVSGELATDGGFGDIQPVLASQSAAVEPINETQDFSDGNTFIGYIPAALNGFQWFPADEEKKAVGYGNKPPTWGNVVDDGNKPVDNATAGATWGSDISLQPADSELLNAQQSADDIGTGTLDGVDVQTGSTGQRSKLNASNGETEFYGDRGDGTIELLATLGIKTVGTDSVIGNFGSDNSDKTALRARSTTGTAVYGTAGTTGIAGFFSKDSSSGNNEAALQCANNNAAGIPFQIRAAGSNTLPGVNITRGDFWVPQTDDQIYYRHSTWQSLNAQMFAETTLSGSATEFTNLPAWPTLYVIMFRAMSTNGTTVPEIQLGDSGGYETSNYFGSVTRVSASGTGASAHGNGFEVDTAWAAANDIYGAIQLSRVRFAGDRWFVNGGFAYDSGFCTQVVGFKDLSGFLDRIRIECGANSFDNGEITLLAAA